MNVTKIILLEDQSLFGRLYFKGTVMYSSSPYRRGGSCRDYSDIFNEKGDRIGKIEGYYFDFGDKDVFGRVTEDDSCKG